MPNENSFVSFVCTSCRQEIEASVSKIGQTVECPACGTRCAASLGATTTAGKMRGALRKRLSTEDSS